MLACWIEDPEGDSFRKHLARIPDYLWVSEDGMKIQVITALITTCMFMHGAQKETGKIKKQFWNIFKVVITKSFVPGVIIICIFYINLLRQTGATIIKVKLRYKYRQYITS